jgi:putative DNA primase/helicase
MTGPRCWFQWDGTRWRRDELLAVREVARQLARAYNGEGKAAPAKSAFITGVLGIAQSDPKFSRLHSDFDQDNYLLNCPDGTYDLSGTPVTRHEHRPGDHITKLTAVSPEPGGGGRFLQFLQEIFEGNNDLIDWVQRALGACLSGAIEDHWLMFWTGAGRNGKNTLGDLVMHILGDYAKAIPADTLMSKKNPEHKTEIVNLMGARLAVASEIEESDFWAESKLKSLTGDARLSGRFMHKDLIEFKRTHKHLIYGNHRPQLRNIDDALRTRMKVVPFRVSFRGREDPDLGAKLWAESSFVLHWLIEGHARWLTAGKNVGSCAVIEAEVEEYMSGQATVDAWVDEQCFRVPDDGRALRGWPTATELYEPFTKWSHDMGVGTRSMVRFTEALRRMGFRRVKAAGVRYVGIELNPSIGKAW